MALGQLNFAGLNKVDVALARLKEFEPPEGYYLAFSGGKDSVVIYNLAAQAQVKFDPHYNQGGIDPPELVQFIRLHYPDMLIQRPPMSLWKKMNTKGMPTRRARWCCELIKEHQGRGRRIVTGIRWEESVGRRQRRLVEVCRYDGITIYVNPIIDWSEREVWEYIKGHGLDYCSLYDEGFHRLGCVMCPMASAKQAQIEAARWPKIAGAWKRACYRRWEQSKARGLTGVDRFASPEDMWQWWITRKYETSVNEDQCVMFDN